MSERARQLRFILRRIDEPTRYINETSRKRISFDRIIVHDLEFVQVPCSRCMRSDLLAKRVDVYVRVVIIGKAERRPLGLVSKRSSKLSILLCRENIPCGSYNGAVCKCGQCQHDNSYKKRDYPQS